MSGMTSNLLMLIVLFAGFSCQSRPENIAASRNLNSDSPLLDSTNVIGKRIRLVYPELTVFESFKSDSTLGWTSVDIGGDREEGQENIRYQIVDEGVHFVGWVTKDGVVVSQIIDLRSMRAYTLISQPRTKGGGVDRKQKVLAGVVRLVK